MKQDVEIVKSRQVKVKEALPEIKKPPRYKVFLLNDDYTPMDFVIEVLQGLFAMNLEQATAIMWQVHTQGKGACGVYSRDIAETKVEQVNKYSRMNEHPLKCLMDVE